MRNVIMIIPPVEFRDEELFETHSILQSAGVEIKIASTIKEKCIGMLGGEIVPDMLNIDIRITDYDALVFVGGDGARLYWDDTIIHKLIADAVMLNKIIAAISTAPVVLANAGILKGKKATVWRSEQQKIVVGGALYTADRVTYDGNVITAEGPESAVQFGRSIVKGLDMIFTPRKKESEEQ